jgi:hypothetical protein
MGRVLVVILAGDGREGGNRPLAAPDCDGSTATVTFLASGGGTFGQLASVSPGSSGDAAGGGSGGESTGGVAGASAGNDDGPPLLPNLAALPALPSMPSEDGGLAWLVAAAIGGTLGAAAFFLATGLRRRRDRAAWN